MKVKQLYPKQWITSKLYFPGEYDKVIKNKFSTLKPTVTQLINAWSGTDKGYWAYAGRCFEFADQIFHAMKEQGYRGMRTITTNEWARNIKNRKDLSIFNNPANMHCWIYYNKRHYDSMNSEGVRNPKQLKFFGKKFQ